MSAHQKAHVTSQPAKVEKSKKTSQPVRAPVKAAQMLEAPETLRSEDVLAAQQQVGNQVVQRALDKHSQRKRVTDDQGNLVPEITGKIQAKRGSGSPLPEAIHKDVSKKFKRDFKNVRLHTDDTADSISRTINARAFTIGNDIFFKKGVFAPGTSAGRETLVHELTHVVQQGGKSGSGKLKLGAPGTAHEKEADRMGKKHAASVSQAPTGAVQRAPEEEELQRQSDEDKMPSSSSSGSFVEATGSHTEGEDAKTSSSSESPTSAGTESKTEGEDAKMESSSESPEVEDDEIKAQPDVGGVVQRAWDKDDQGNWKKKFPSKPNYPPPPVPSSPIPDAPDVTPKMQLEAVSQQVAQLHPGPKPKQSGKPTPSFSEQIKSGSEKMQGSILTRGSRSLGIEKNRFEGIEKNRSEKFNEMQSYKDSTDPNNSKLERSESGDQKTSSHRGKLIATINNPKSSPEEVKAAKEKLDTIFKPSKMETLKRAFSKEGVKSMWRRKSLNLDPSKEAMFDRKKNLKKAARSGDEDAFKQLSQMKAEKKKAAEEKAAKGSPTMNFLKDKVGGFLKKKLLGDDKDKDEKGGGGVTVNVNGPSAGGGGAPTGGGGDSSIVAVMQQYAHVVEENKKLKEELAKAKNPV